MISLTQIERNIIIGSLLGDGNNYVLGIYKQNDIVKFLDLVRLYVSMIDCMKYKVDVKERLESEKKKLEQEHKENPIKVTTESLSVVDNSYSIEDEEFIIYSKRNGIRDKDIAEKLDRPYWDVVDKLKRLRSETDYKNFIKFL